MHCISFQLREQRKEANILQQKELLQEVEENIFTTFMMNLNLTM